jgi:hypothetical protein
MRTITLKLYSFNGLERSAKEKALTTYRDFNVSFNWWEHEYEDFIWLCACMGIKVDFDSIKFRGFYSQGDGSSFSAKVDIPKLITAIEISGWKMYAPEQDFPFVVPATNPKVLALVAKGLLPSEPQIIGRTRNYGVVTNLGIWEAIQNGKEHHNIFEELDKLEDWLRGIVETLNQHLYTSLEKQYEFLISDDAVKESILNNEYLFTADGRSADHLLAINNRKK